MNKKIFVVLLSIVFFVGMPTVFADDKGLTEHENFRIRVIVENDKIPVPIDGDSTKQKDLEENDDIDLEEDDGGFSVIKTDTKSSDISEYEKVLNAYKKWNFEILINSNKEKINIGQDLPISINIKTISKKELDLSEYIKDAYIIIRDENGNIISKQDLWDLSNNIDFLNLVKSKNLKETLEVFLKYNLLVPNKPGEYSLELTMIFSANFLDLDKEIADKYQIEVKSNKLNFIINEIKQDTCSINANKQYSLYLWIFLLIVVIIVFVIWILFTVRRVFADIIKNKV